MVLLIKILKCLRTILFIWPSSDIPRWADHFLLQSSAMVCNHTLRYKKQTSLSDVPWSSETEFTSSHNTRLYIRVCNFQYIHSLIFQVVRTRVFWQKLACSETAKSRPHPLTAISKIQRLRTKIVVTQDGGSTLLRNISIGLTNYTASHPIIEYSHRRENLFPNRRDLTGAGYEVKDFH
jgi:hypothetical protein